MMAPSAKLTIEMPDKQVVVHLVIVNHSDRVLYLEKTKIVAAPPLRAKLFRILCEGKEVPYTGALAKKRAPTREDYFRVEPGGVIKGFAEISDLYAFLPGVHQYTIEYRTFHGNPDDPSKLTEIVSDPASLELQR